MSVKKAVQLRLNYKFDSVSTVRSSLPCSYTPELEEEKSFPSS